MLGETMVSRLIAFIRTMFGYAIIGLFGSIVMLPFIFNAMLPESIRFNRFYYWGVDIYFKIAVWATFLPITIEGRENIPKTPAIFAANHQSAFDIPLLGSLMNGYPHIWLFLKRYSKIPFFGFIVRRMNVVVDLAGLRKAISSIWEGIDRVKGKNRHLLIFPEGGRATDDRVHDFFYGFAVIAKETGRPVVPVIMFNVNKAYPPGSFLVNWYPIKMVVGKPFLYQEQETLDSFVERVHAWFIKQAQQYGSGA
jgi:1-acyl-sn-glycerol-3-phosphate acyltransferase